MKSSEKITFSSDTGKVTRDDIEETSRMSVEYFFQKEDKTQMFPTPEYKEYVYKKSKNYLNVIKSNGEIIGYVFMLPCTIELMNEFLSKRIDENILVERITKIKFNGVPEAIYLCASIVKEEYRRRGLATTAFMKLIKKITKNAKKRPVIFYWAYSPEGKALNEKRKKLIDLEMLSRE